MCDVIAVAEADVMTSSSSSSLSSSSSWSVADVDLNCRENISLNSDTDEQSDSDTIENKVFPQQRFSPVTSPKHRAALRPRPIKGGARSEMTLVTSPPAVRPCVSSAAFQPRGDVFKAHRDIQLHNSAGKCGRNCICVQKSTRLEAL